MIGGGGGALKFATDGLENVQQTSAKMRVPKSGLEKLMQVHLSMAKYETLLSVGKDTAECSRPPTRRCNRRTRIFASTRSAH
jgi:hypothetical protein